MSVSLPTVEDYEKLLKKVEALTLLVKHMALSLCAKQVVTIADICSMESVSKSQVMGKERYLLPNFGLSDYPEGVIRWKWDTYVAWRDIPASQRKEMYAEHLKNIVRGK